MVSVVHSVASQSDLEQSLATLVDGLNEDEASRIRACAEFALTVYDDKTLGDGEGAWHHALGMALILAGLKLDAESRLAALLFALPYFDEHGLSSVEARAGHAVSQLVSGVSRLNRLRPITRGVVNNSHASPQEAKAQVEILRKMLLAVVEDIRVVLIRLASRTQTLRFYTENPSNLNLPVAQETLEIYSPLANRLGVWELKWELEDLSFRFLNPDTYRQIARMLDEKRSEREQFISEAIGRVKQELGKINITAEVYGRPKHIYSIWNKMRQKGLDFSEVYDVRALRVIVDEVKDCYAALGVVHNLWTPISKEFDDYISKPKGNQYRSLHTAVACPDGRSLEVQIRTWEMHQHAELGVAAHWRYKEGRKNTAEDNYDEKIAWLRKLLSWKDEVAESSDWVKNYKEAALDETIYVMTPQGKVIDLPRDSTPVDFAYWIHTDLGHRCRGAKVDGVLVPLNTPLKTGQRVEIISAKEGAPSRDWLNANQGYLNTTRARSKVRHWFSSLALEEALAEGKTIVNRELQRLGQTHASLDDIAHGLGYTKANDLLIAAARNELNLRLFQSAVRGDLANETSGERADIAYARPPSAKGDQGILIVGIGQLLTQLARCCKPAPPDEICGFVTRGKGVSIHRADCPDFANLSSKHPERVIETDWGNKSDGLFAADVVVDAHDRYGLLRDISDIFAREKINVIAVNTQSKKGRARMGFTVEIDNLQHLQKTLAQIHEVPSVVGARRV